MTQKFGRNYQLTIDPKDGGPVIVVSLPFTIQFSMHRDTGASINQLSIDIYNLSEANRSRIFQDRWDLRQQQVNGVAVGARTMILEVGYSTLYTIFSGNIFQASSAREGTNIITRLEARTGQYDIAAAQVFQTLQSGTTVADVLTFLIGQFPSLQLGAIGNYPAKLNRPVVLNGSVYELLKKYAPSDVYIDNGNVYVMGDNEVLNIPEIIIDDSTGLLETPRREGSYLSVTTLLEASVNLLQYVNLQSSVQPAFNGRYKVMGINHTGTISAAVGGDCRTIFSLLAPNFFPRPALVNPS